MNTGMTISFRNTASIADPLGFSASDTRSPAPTITSPRLSEALASMSMVVITGP
ncbi:hypothetical protein D3C71_2172520 [compost metagenome]